MQHIVYTEWLPKVIGPKGMKELGEYKGYNPNVDASIFNSFTTAALRYEYNNCYDDFRFLRVHKESVSHVGGGGRVVRQKDDKV